MTFLEHAVPYIESKPEAGYYDPDLEMKYAKVDEGYCGSLYDRMVFVCSSRYCDIRLNKPPDDLEVDSEAGCKEAK